MLKNVTTLALKSLCKALLLLSRHITLFLINTLSVRGAVLRFHQHFSFRFEDTHTVSLRGSRSLGKKKRVKFALEQAMKAQIRSRGTALLFL